MGAHLAGPGKCLPANETVVAQFLADLAAQAQAHGPNARLAPPVQKLAILLHSDPALRMYGTQAIEQALAAGYTLGYRNLDELIPLVNALMTYAPPFDTSELVGCPLNALLNWPMCMPAGFALFRSPAVNRALKAVLNHWCAFLCSPASRSFLNSKPPTGWFSPEALSRIGMQAFNYAEHEPYGGFASWNDFFTRTFRPGARPVASPDNNKIIVHACEAAPYNIQHAAQLSDAFWAKGQPYSLQDIFTPAYRSLARRFVDGTVYQAFLNAYSYHRWHAPVSGTVRHAYQVDGTYFSGVESAGLDAASPYKSQGYLAAAATRTVIVIDCDDESLGSVAGVFIGMAEISSCVRTVAPGSHVSKGDEIGYFQYGGSTYCLIFEPGVIQSFVPHPPFTMATPPLPVNSHLATAN